MKRQLIIELETWKNDRDRKVLLLRGARQVGKTYLIREFGKLFRNSIEINFEKNSEFCSFFEQNLDAGRIINDLSIFLGEPIEDGKTLLFFDEIQKCPRAIEALRYFYEDRKGLHVIAAGSLLEFALEEIASFGVGRIRSLFMYPMSFDEFILASGEESLLELKRNATPSTPLQEPFHNKLIDLLKKHLILGGMPEVVKTYLGGGNIRDIRNILSDISISYYDDFEKYRRNVPVLRLKEVMDSVIRQSGGKFVFSQSSTTSSPQQARDALNLLEMAGLVHKAYHTSGQGIPLGSGMNIKMFKALILDTGILQMLLDFKLTEPMLAGNIDMLNKGSLAEVYAGLEMIKYANPYAPFRLFYWHREKRGSSAEVDYLVSREEEIVPLEVKSGSTGKMQSMNLFMQERGSNKGFRVSLENFSSYEKIEVIPLYALSNLRERDYL